MLIYIHVPFCRLRCHYCAFYSVPLGRNVQPSASPDFRKYVDTLLMEIALWGDRLRGRSVRTIFFGGGTPSLLPPKIVDTILNRLHAVFSIAPGCEITLEANPESFRPSLAPSEYRKAGITRLSIGMQSLDSEILHRLGRVHKSQDCYTAFHAARDAGFANIGVDLMWGVPGQSIRHWLRTLKSVITLAPEHISAYGMTIEQGTRFEQEAAEGRLLLPSENDQRVMFLEGAALLEKHGYLQYEISNYSRMGFQCRHNIGYWEGAEYLGLGPSATSTIGNLRFTNPARQDAWEEKIEKRQTGEDEEVLSPLVRVLETIMLRLRMTKGLPLGLYKRMTGHDFLLDHRRMVQALHDNGLVRIRNNHMRLTLHGMLVSNSILANLFEQTRTVLQTALSASSNPSNPLNPSRITASTEQESLPHTDAARPEQEAKTPAQTDLPPHQAETPLASDNDSFGQDVVGKDEDDFGETSGEAMPDDKLETTEETESETPLGSGQGDDQDRESDDAPEGAKEDAEEGPEEGPEEGAQNAASEEVVKDTSKGASKNASKDTSKNASKDAPEVDADDDLDVESEGDLGKSGENGRAYPAARQETGQETGPKTS